MRLVSVFAKLQRANIAHRNIKPANLISVVRHINPSFRKRTYEDTAVLYFTRVRMKVAAVMMQVT